MAILYPTLLAAGKAVTLRLIQEAVCYLFLENHSRLWPTTIKGQVPEDDGRNIWQRGGCGQSGGSGIPFCENALNRAYPKEAVPLRSSGPSHR